MTEHKDFAKGSKVDIATSEAQIKRMLQKEGADAVAIMEERDRAVVAFHLQGRNIRFNLPLPKRDDFSHSKAGARGLQPNKQSTIDNLWMQASRERWRQLHLCIKAKLESVAQNIETFDESFLAHVVAPDGETIGDKVKPQMAALMDGKPLRPLLEHH